MSVAGFLSTTVPLRLASSGSVVAIPILAVDQLGDVSIGGALVATSLAPAALAAPLVGVALDRSRHPRRLVAASAVVTVVGFGAATLIGILPLPVIAVMLLATGFAAPFYMGGMSSFVTDEIRGEHRAYGIDAGVYNLSSVIGPGVVALAGLTGVPRLGMGLMAGVGLISVFGSLMLLMPPRPSPTESAWRTVVAGLRHLIRHRPISVATTAATVSQLGMGALPIAAVALSLERIRTAADAAFIVTAFAVGGLTGAILTAVRPPSRLTPPAVLGFGFAAVGLVTLAAVPDLGIWVAMVAIGLSGLIAASTSVALMQVRKQQSPIRVRSQVFTIGSGLRAMASGVGAAIAGAFADVSAGWLLIGIAFVWLISGAMMLAYPRGAEPLDAT